MELHLELPSPMKVVVVEDDPDLGQLIMATLSYEEFDSELVAQDFYRALEPETWEGASAAVVDMMLPGEYTGVEILRYLRDTRPQVKRIAFTAIADHIQGDDISELAQAWVQKPDLAGVIAALQTDVRES